MFAGCCPLRVLISWKRAKGYSTGYSQAVTHPSTNPACGCLTSEIERDRVHSTEYGRIRSLSKYVDLYTESKYKKRWISSHKDARNSQAVRTYIACNSIRERVLLPQIFQWTRTCPRSQNTERLSCRVQGNLKKARFASSDIERWFLSAYLLWRRVCLSCVQKIGRQIPITFLTNHNELLFITYRSVWWGSDIINFGIKHPPHVSVSLAYSVFGQLKFFGFLPSLLLFYFQSTPLVVFGRTIFYRIVFCKAVSELPWVQTISGSSDTSAFSIICSWQQTILKTYDSL